MSTVSIFHSLLYSTLNETSNELLEITTTLSQKNFMNFVRNEILTVIDIHVNFIFVMCGDALRFVLLTIKKNSFVLACILRFGSNVA